MKTETNNAVKHTPGPWHIDGHGVMGYINTRLETVCTVYPLSPVDKCNARLIAAAPELLEACLEELKDWEIVMATSTTKSDRAVKQYEQLKAAIAKATGETL